MKRFKDAKDFAKNPPYKINKNLLEKVLNAENTNKRISADNPIIEAVHEEVGTVVESDVSIGAKKQQFTSEKILEDELMLRIESGIEVFGKRLKIYYTTQVGVKPPTFVVFVNDKELMHFSYTRYLENRIRETFGFRGTSLKFIIRERKDDK